MRQLRAAVAGKVFREVASGAKTERAQPPRSLWRATAIGRALYVKVQSLPWMSANRPHRFKKRHRSTCHNRMVRCRRNRKWVQRNLKARRVSFGKPDGKLTALNPGIRPDLLLIKQVDQVRVLNDRLP